jgi:hypothetical protein
VVASGGWEPHKNTWLERADSARSSNRDRPSSQAFTSKNVTEMGLDKSAPISQEGTKAFKGANPDQDPMARLT